VVLGWRVSDWWGKTATAGVAAKRCVRLEAGDWACFLVEARIIIVLLVRRMVRLKVSMKGSG